MSNKNKMTIKIQYDGDKFGAVYIHSPVGGRNRLCWKIGFKVLMFGGWLMFGKREKWMTRIIN